jgi:pimeloyl-ACP methyl ester carboxylesterase
VAKGQDSNGTIPRGDGQLYSALYCAFWPEAPAQVTRSKPLVLENVPVLVLNAKLDPATPFHEGQAVFERLANGYHVYVEGGVHAIYGWGNDCPDLIVEEALVNGTFPKQRETVCEWDPAVMAPYIDE